MFKVSNTIIKFKKPFGLPNNNIYKNVNLRFLSTTSSTTTEQRSKSKPTVVVVGTGWAGARAARDIDVNKFDLKVVSVRNHMVFTPLLPQTCCGTLEFRSICETITTIQPALKSGNNDFFYGYAYELDTTNKKIKCIAVDPLTDFSAYFDVPYDVCILAHGAQPMTFGVPGVEDNAYFLREVHQSRGIRKKLLKNVGLAMVPGIPPEVRQRYLKVVVVGGGPTGVEFASDLCDFLNTDLERMGHGLRSEFEVILVEAGEVLGTFDHDLREYAARNLQKIGVKLRRAIVQEVHEKHVVLSDGETISYGLLVWNTGVGPSDFTKSMSNLDKTRQGRIAVDDKQRVLKSGKPIDGLYAAGDCCGEYPQLAQVAERQAMYISATVNSIFSGSKQSESGSDASTNSVSSSSSETSNVISVRGVESGFSLSSDVEKDFKYTHRGSFASVGDYKALIDLPVKRFNMTGIMAWFTWRSAYMTKLGSIRSRLYVAVNWSATLLFGRDVTYIANSYEVRQGIEKTQSILTEKEKK